MIARAGSCGVVSGLLVLLASACSPAPVDKPASREAASAPRAPSPAAPDARRVALAGDAALDAPLAATDQTTTPVSAPAPSPSWHAASTSRVASTPVPALVQAPADLPASDLTSDPKPFPRAVTQFMVERDGCDHFRGEDAYDADRLAFLEENMRQLCTGTDARLAALRARYARNPDVTAALGQYEDRIETSDAPP
jgi:hypothetical protein